MEPMTLVAISGIAAFGALVLYCVKNRSRSAVADNIAAARERAAEKARFRAFAPTQPFDDFIPILPQAEAVEIDDKYDGRAALTADQLRIIDLVMNNTGKVETVEMTDPWEGRA